MTRDAPAKGAEFYLTGWRNANTAAKFEQICMAAERDIFSIFFKQLFGSSRHPAGRRPDSAAAQRFVVIIAPMEDRKLTPLDRIISGLDNALRTINSAPTRAARPSPAADIEESSLTEQERTHAAGLMRVNHAGEVAAQGLYQGHAAIARDPNIEDQMKQAADEELDHLAWCERRLEELGSGPSLLRPLWYTGAFAMGAASGVLGDKWSLGFIEETERQVSEHLTGHLDRLPENDAKSRAIVTQMRAEEEAHGAHASEAGAAGLPLPVRGLMRTVAKIMTATAYRI